MLGVSRLPGSCSTLKLSSDKILIQKVELENQMKAESTDGKNRYLIQVGLEPIAFSTAMTNINQLRIVHIDCEGDMAGLHLLASNL